MAGRYLVGLCLGLCWVAAGFAVGPLAWDQSDVVVPSEVAPLKTYTVADDFTVPGTLATYRVTSACVWMQDWMELPVDGTLTGFNSTVGWAIYTDAAGVPGSLVASGSDTAAILLGPTVPSWGWDTQMVHFRIDPPVTVTSGTYWLAIRQGAWGAAGGPEEHYASASAQTRGHAAMITTIGGVPTSFIPGGGADLAFVIYGSTPGAELLFASGFEAGVTCAWTQTTGGSTCP